MSYTKSLSMIVTSSKRADCNNLMEALGRGSNTFAVDLSPSGARAETHYGAHTYDDVLEAILVGGVIPIGPDWAAYGLTAVSAQQALEAIRFVSRADRNSVANFEGLATAQGVKPIREPLA